MQSKITKNENAEVEIEVEIPHEEVEKHKESALKKLGGDIELPGFRKGKAPASLLEKHVKPEALLHEMAERAVGEHFPNVFAEHKVMPLGRPHVTITKLAPGNPLGFKIKTSVLPEVELPDYKAIAKEHNEKKEEPVTVDDQELERAIEDVLRRIREAKTEQGPNTSAKTQGEAKPETSELTDELVQKLGNYKDVADFKTQLREQMKQQKKLSARERKRLAIADEIISETKVSVPEILVEGELGKMLARFKGDVISAGMKFEDYLTQIKKSEEDLKREWRPDALKQAKLQLVLNKIAQEESLGPDKDRLEAELKHLLEHQPDADRQMARIYVASILTNEKVFEFLENQKQKENS